MAQAQHFILSMFAFLVLPFHLLITPVDAHDHRVRVSRRELMCLARNETSSPWNDVNVFLEVGVKDAAVPPVTCDSIEAPGVPEAADSMLQLTHQKLASSYGAEMKATGGMRNF